MRIVGFKYTVVHTKTRSSIVHSNKYLKTVNSTYNLE